MAHDPQLDKVRRGEQRLSSRRFNQLRSKFQGRIPFRKWVQRKSDLRDYNVSGSRHSEGTYENVSFGPLGDIEFAGCTFDDCAFLKRADVVMPNGPTLDGIRFYCCTFKRCHFDDAHRRGERRGHLGHVADQSKSSPKRRDPASRGPRARWPQPQLRVPKPGHRRSCRVPRGLARCVVRARVVCCSGPPPLVFDVGRTPRTPRCHRVARTGRRTARGARLRRFARQSTRDRSASTSAVRLVAAPKL